MYIIHRFKLKSLPVLLLVMSGAAQAYDLDTWRKTKYPWLYTTTPNEVQASTESSTTTVDSIEAWRKIKFPWLYPTSSGERSSTANNDLPQSGSIEALRRAKYPWLYQKTANELAQ